MVKVTAPPQRPSTMDVSSNEIGFDDSGYDGPSSRQAAKTTKGRASGEKKMKELKKVGAPAPASEAKKKLEKQGARSTTAKARGSEEKKTTEKASAPAGASQQKKTPTKTTPSARTSQDKKAPEKNDARQLAGEAYASEKTKTAPKSKASARASEEKKTLEKAKARPSTIKPQTCEENKTPETTSVRPTARARASEVEKSQEEPRGRKRTRQDDPPYESSDTTPDSGTEEDQIPPKKSKQPAAKVASGARGSNKSKLVPESASESGNEQEQSPPTKPKKQLVKAASRAKKSTLVEKSESGAHEDEIVPEKIKIPAAQAAGGMRQPKKATLMNDLKDPKSEDMIPTPQKPRQSKRPSSTELLGKAKRRSLTRNAVEPKKVNYSMKYHPMDKATRPYAPTTRRVKDEFEADEEDEEDDDDDDDDDDEEEADEDDGAEADDEATPTKVALRGRRGEKTNYDMTAHPSNPLLQTKNSSRKSSSKTESPAMEDNLMAFSDIVGHSWTKLDPVDKRLHDLQEGAPDDSNALPLRWSVVVSTLIEEGYFTRKQFNRGGGVPAMRERYEEIRQIVQGPCADLEPEDRDNRRLYYQEGFDVFDVEGLNSVYVNPNIPDSMRGIKKFTAKDIAKCEQEIENSRTNVLKDNQDTPMSKSSTTKLNEPQKITNTLSEPEESEALDTPDKRSAPLLENDIQMNELNEHTVSTADVAMDMDDFGQATPAKIILSRSASAAGPVADSPSRCQIESAPKTKAARIASMVIPLTQDELDEELDEELAEESIAAAKAFLGSPPPKTRNSSSSLNLVDDLFAGSNADISEQFPGEAKPPTIFGKIMAEGIPGSTKKQLKRGKHKIRAAASTNFAIHEDTPGNTPKGNRRRDAITLETLKENMPEEWEHPQPMLDALTAQYDDGQARRQVANVVEARQRVGTPRPSHSSPSPLVTSSPFRPSGGLSGVIPNIEDSTPVDAPAVSSAAAQAHGISRGISVVIPRFVRESQG